MPRQFFARAVPDLTRFFHWWIGELKAVPPARLKALLTPEQPSCLIEFGTRQLTVRYRNGEKTQSLGRFELSASTLEQQRQSLARILNSRKTRGAEIVLRLQPEDSMRWQLSFPRAAVSDLQKAIAFQVTQKTPFRAEETFNDHRIVARSSDGGEIRVEVALAPRERVQTVLAKAQAWHITPDRIDVSAPEDDLEEGTANPSGFNLLPPDQKPKARQSIARLNAVLATLLAGLLVVTVALPLLQQRSVLEDLEAQLAVARREAETTLQLQSEIEELSRQRSFLAVLKQSQPLQVVVLEELTRVLPDHTFLTELRIKGSSVSITGSSASASSLVGRLEGSQLFQRPKFRSPVAQDSRNGQERFSLSFELAMTGGSSDDRQFSQ